MSQDVKMYQGTPPVLTTFTNVTIDSDHQLELVNVGETVEYDVKIGDDASNSETTTFIGISPKR